MNRRDYMAHVALRDTARMDRSHAYAPAVVIHKPQPKPVPFWAPVAAAMFCAACMFAPAFFV
jgi:hypothetical protein